ncbi:NAD(P)-dependent dehydrogenase (short-subunit alcohol dehydrogenase family) [Streptomyces griseochromogenes]|uniref:NAD(P)-dependent dehydrogenase (Short-subunit alcohol dehydrogenase family) n=1 Tax=Streptomyces griseochromogenes TaxID=68214 RepID=A0A1B1B0T5_9ACTN|nr:SDR family oxidoreductase [Streptomyces griseochromogenes]ANP52435.1 short-chain dehydrogenase [Streptomyces griseochromogenes]MBP2055912.1 NAD(P)-dependent dehydrogenase (short-subunit alcohol dehydrogenase family) [Streptomyces griseochromogenes]
MSSQSSKIVLITGTSSGIGLAAAVSAARAGWTTVATLRDPSRSDALRKAAAEAGVELDIRRLDVTDEASITSAIDGVLADYGHLDAVVNNAGAGHLGTLENESVAEVRKVMEVNFFGVLNVSKAAMPHLRASGGRLITVTSVGGVIGQPFNEAYCAAKFAVEGYMESLAPVAAAHGVSVSVIEPGAVATEFVANVGVDLEQAVAGAGVYAPQLSAYVNRTVAQFLDGAQTAEGAAEAVIEALTADQPAFRLQTSDWARGFVGTKITDLDGSAVLGITNGWVA